MGTRYADHMTPLYPQKLALTSPTGSGRSVGIVRVRTKATEFYIKCTILTFIRKARVSILYYLKFFCYIFRVQIPIIQDLFFASPKHPKRLWGPTQLPIQWLPEFFPRVKLPGHEINHSLLSNAKVGNEWSYRPTSTRTNAFIVRTGETLPFNTATLIPKIDISS